MSEMNHQFEPDEPDADGVVIMEKIFKEILSRASGPIIDAGTTQVELEILYSKHQSLRLIKQEAIEAGLPAMLKDKGIDIEFGLEALAQMQLHKQADMATLGGILLKHFDHMEDPAQACSDALFDMAQYDFINFNTDTRKFVLRYAVSADIEDRIEMFQYPLPMIDPPRTVTSNRQTGYETIRGSLVLRNNHTDDDICLDHINAANSVPLRINNDTVSFVQNKWAGLDKQKSDESREDFLKRRTAFKTYDHVSRDVINVMNIHGRFWLTHKYDKRGRTYAQGYHVNYQSNDWCKACVEFADGEPLNKD